jgi:hypothetical protein
MVSRKIAGMRNAAIEFFRGWQKRVAQIANLHPDNLKSHGSVLAKIMSAK